MSSLPRAAGRCKRAQRSEGTRTQCLDGLQASRSYDYTISRCLASFGYLLADMARQEELEIARVPKAFANDILIALSCREAGCVLVTENERDFSRIRRFVSFEFMMPVARQ